MDRSEVYKLLDGEREYQDKKWNKSTSPCAGKHSPAEFLVMIEDYLREAQHIWARDAGPNASFQVMDIIRKIGGMSVSAMEQHYTPPRFIPTH